MARSKGKAAEKTERGQPRARAPSEPTAPVVNDLSDFGVPFNMENIDVVTGLGLGSTRIVKRPGFDEPPEPKNQIEVEIIGVDNHDTRIGFDAVELDNGVLNGLNRLISVVSEVSHVARSEINLLLFQQGQCDSKILQHMNPYKGTDVDARLHEAIQGWKSTDEGQQASEDAQDVWWAAKRKELDELSVQQVSIQQLIHKIQPRGGP
jgi:hypothetical protein